MKETSLKKLHAAWFHLYDILRKVVGVEARSVVTKS